MKLTIASLCVAAAVASPLKQTATGWCHTSWWPATCELVSAGNCIGTEYPTGGYASESICLGLDATVPTATPVPFTGWCHTSWWPAACASGDQSACIGAEYPAGGFATEALCVEGQVTTLPTPEPTAAPVAFTGWCHTAWWPAMCASGDQSACIGAEYPSGGYASEAACLGTDAATPATGWCHTAWWPAACELISNGNCLSNEYPAGGYASEMECLGTDYTTPTATPAPAGDGYCHTSWWPETCALISAGGCISTEYPAGGYASESACLTNGGTTVTEDPTEYCITAWWPKACGLAISSGCLSEERFASESECRGLTGTDFENSGSDGYCVTSWWPTHSCGVVSAGGCIGWYPPNGWTSESACMGTSKKSAQNINKKAGRV